MKYKNGFKSPWFYATAIICFLIQAVYNLRIYGELYLAEYFGILIGSFIVVLIVYSIGYLMVKFSKKVTKR